MTCIICGSSMSFYFAKTFQVHGLGDVEYWRCPGCGFCGSKTHLDMTGRRWTELNEAFHSATHHARDNPFKTRNRRYFDQALMLFLLTKHAVIEPGQWLDWGSGTGAVSRLLDGYFDLTLLTYDRYFTPQINEIREDRLVPGAFDLVMNAAVFEHVRDRGTLDEIESFVADSGCLAVHTLVGESVPRDPGWMYLRPVHCAFHTNRSMQILMDSWGYSCSVYNPDAKLWVMFRQDSDSVESNVSRMNEALGWEYLHFKRGFVDYWK